MTMPDERLRAVGWGGELLTQIATDTALPDVAIEAARRIALAYPARQALEDWLLSGESGARGLPPAWAAALLDALELFDAVRMGALGSATTRSDLRYTLRHCPDRTTVRAMSCTSSIQEWLRRPTEW